MVSSRGAPPIFGEPFWCDAVDQIGEQCNLADSLPTILDTSLPGRDGTGKAELDRLAQPPGRMGHRAHSA